MIKPNSKQGKSRRYRLHRNLKPYYKIQARQRMVLVPCGANPENKQVQAWLNELIGFGYNVQVYFE